MVFREFIFTTDPYNKPQLKIKKNNFRTIFNEDNTKIRTKWSRIVLEDKLTIPLDQGE